MTQQAACVSVLFSEPKIPQFLLYTTIKDRLARFSALQRAENSSIETVRPARVDRERFSALQRAENSSITYASVVFAPRYSFSALQRAENSSIGAAHRRSGACAWFQCSSASRKFLNCGRGVARCGADRRFSALQRAENSSISADVRIPFHSACFSALQRAENSSINRSAL